MWLQSISTPADGARHACRRASPQRSPSQCSMHARKCLVQGLQLFAQDLCLHVRPQAEGLEVAAVLQRLRFGLVWFSSAGRGRSGALGGLGRSTAVHGAAGVGNQWPVQLQRRHAPEAVPRC